MVCYCGMDMGDDPAPGKVSQCSEFTHNQVTFQGTKITCQLKRVFLSYSKQELALSERISPLPEPPALCSPAQVCCWAAVWEFGHCKPREAPVWLRAAVRQPGPPFLSCLCSEIKRESVALLLL